MLAFIVSTWAKYSTYFFHNLVSKFFSWSQLKTKFQVKYQVNSERYCRKSMQYFIMNYLFCRIQYKLLNSDMYLISHYTNLRYKDTKDTNENYKIITHSSSNIYSEQSAAKSRYTETVLWQNPLYKEENFDPFRFLHISCTLHIMKTWMCCEKTICLLEFCNRWG